MKGSSGDAWARNVALLGAVLMAAMVFPDWGTVETGAGTVSVDGLDRGGVWLLAAALISAIGVLAGRPEAAVVCAVLATGYLALTAYQLPGVLIDEQGGSEATVALSVFAALLGAVVLLAAAARCTALAQERARRR